MKKTIATIILLLVATMIYVFTRPEEKQKTIYRDTDQPKATDTEKPKSEKIVEAAPANNTPLPNSGNLSPETGWSAFPKADEQPAPDVTAQINIGNGSPEPKTISSKQGQRISITFTSSVRDQVIIGGFNINTYVEPQRDSIISFMVNKPGQFAITLVRLKKTIGILNIEKYE
jgi:heme/copper-type cytochrome/quinol oxidase subunit 2